MIHAVFTEIVCSWRLNVTSKIDASISKSIVDHIGSWKTVSSNQSLNCIVEWVRRIQNRMVAVTAACQTRNVRRLSERYVFCSQSALAALHDACLSISTDPESCIVATIFSDRFPNQRDSRTYKGGRKKTNHLRWTSFVSHDEAANILAANYFATQVGVPINAHVTIDLNDNVSDAETPAIISLMLRNWRQELRRRGVDGSGTTHIWAREKRAGMPNHVHLLLHIPQPLMAGMNTREIARFIPRKAAIDYLDLPKWPKERSGVPVFLRLDEKSSENWGRYIIKGIAREHAASFAISASPQGRLPGKRTHVAENIGSHARRQWAFDARVYGHEFALLRWQEHSATAKRLPSTHSS